MMQYLIRLLLVSVFLCASQGAMASHNPVLVSVDSNEVQGGAPSSEPAVSADGDIIVFHSDATNLVTNDNNQARDVFLRDTQNGTTIAVSVNTTGGMGNSLSQDPVVSADGRYVAFESGANDLVANDTNGTTDIFVRDITSNTTTRVSVSTGGTEGDLSSVDPAISADGRYVVFWSNATNLVANDDNNQARDVFLRDTVSNITTRLSIDANGNEADLDSFAPVISADGHYVAFQSDATNLVPDDTNGKRDIFVKNIQTGTIALVSTSSTEIQSDNSSNRPAINVDGQFVTFYSEATNLVASDGNTARDVFVKNTRTGDIVRASTSSSGAEGNSLSSHPAISDDGRYVVFWSIADNLVTGDTAGERDVFIKDIYTGLTARLSTSSAEAEGNGRSEAPAISADAGVIVFHSTASNLVDADGNISRDVFSTDNTLFVSDTDGDGLRDDVESVLGTDPNLVDTDGDGLLDSEEDANFNGMTDLGETSPSNRDTDGDGFSDGYEVKLGTDPLDPLSIPANRAMPWLPLLLR